uniref:Uncharacterized protein n=1 Tax=Candidatus Kentrum sp. MB TaxID=2138164 RepID=A0A451BFC6_9GAMM|nr:MAG: hypothetical protein BECKMB1821G_GA0114241_11017 [Candidatus Kentron sp. MB]VFK35121.1 MAG: hypothetical protein BECKMB1821I_GA0114274_11018 [Candidatus Kentron sp. MB]VFK76986.1 MAG: hypothetical protein BECKMB1821H_GA0114242_10888 [Candidatus Kentron sp. MB]
MSNIKVIAGDLDNGAWQFVGMFGSATMSRASTTKSLWKGESIDLKTEVDNIEQLTEEKVKKLAGTAGWGIAGAMLLGPLGAIGGMLLGGNKKDVAFACYLKDGRKFMATTDGKTWQKITAARFG